LIRVQPHSTGGAKIQAPHQVDDAETPNPGIGRELPDVVPGESAADSGPLEPEAQSGSVSAESSNEQPPPELPIVLPPEYDYLAEPSQRLNIHHTLEREPYDPDWAPAMESQIAQFLAENPEIAQTYGYPTITCRTTRCEAAFVAHGLDPNLGLGDELDYLEDLGLSDFEVRRIGIGEHFAGLTSEFFETPGFEQFTTFNGYPSVQIRPEDGVTTLLWHMSDTSQD
jgi:hypothetical protein